MRSRDEILKDKNVGIIYLTLEVLLDLRDLLKEISIKIRDDMPK